MNEGYSLLAVKRGQSARVISISEKALAKSMAFGVLPGTIIKVLQVFPVYVLQIEHTELAVDVQFVKNIWVEKI